MKGFAILCLMEMIAASAAYSTDHVIWPMSPQDGTQTLFHSFGDYHRAWTEATSSGINFHFGIDLTDPTPLVPDDADDDRMGHLTIRGNRGAPSLCAAGRLRGRRAFDGCHTDPDQQECQ